LAAQLSIELRDTPALDQSCNGARAGGAIVDSLITVIVQTITEFLFWFSLLSITDQLKTLRSTDQPPLSLTEPDPQLAGSALIWELLICLPIAVIIQIVTALLRRGAKGPFTLQAITLFTTDPEPLSLADPLPQITDLPQLRPKLIHRPIAVVIQIITALLLRLPRGNITARL